MKRTRNYVDELDPTIRKLWRTAIDKDYDLVKFTQFAANRDIDTATVPEFIWPAGGVFTFPTSAAATAVVSSSASDASAGTGARTITVDGLDSDYNEVVQTVTLNGVTPVSLPTNLFRVNTMEVATAGSGRVNAGTIDITIGGTKVSEIPASRGVAQTAVFTVPNNYSQCLLLDLFVNVAQGAAGSVTIELWKRLPNGLEQELVSYFLDTQATSFIDRNLIEEPIVFDPKTDLWFKVTEVSNNNTKVGIIWKFVKVQQRALR